MAMLRVSETARRGWVEGKTMESQGEPVTRGVHVREGVMNWRARVHIGKSVSIIRSEPEKTTEKHGNTIDPGPWQYLSRGSCDVGLGPVEVI